VNLDKDFDFCGEKFPMDNWDVRQRLDAELLRNVYFHSQTILAVKRANAIFPIIEPIIKEEGAPSDLKYLAVAESALSNAISPAGARGVWQFMKDAAGGYGLEVNAEVDERYHLEKATRAACKYMKKEKERLGSWVLAAAAYNGGPGRILEEMAKQRAKNFFTLLCHAIRLLKSESSHDSELQQLAGQYFLSPNFNFFLYDLKRSLWVGLKVFENLSDLTLEGCAVS
jgi:hypothetical protein